MAVAGPARDVLAGVDPRRRPAGDRCPDRQGRRRRSSSIATASTSCSGSSNEARREAWEALQSLAAEGAWYVDWERGSRRGTVAVRRAAHFPVQLRRSTTWSIYRAWAAGDAVVGPGAGDTAHVLGAGHLGKARDDRCARAVPVRHPQRVDGRDDRWASSTPGAARSPSATASSASAATSTSCTPGWTARTSGGGQRSTSGQRGRDVTTRSIAISSPAGIGTTTNCATRCGRCGSAVTGFARSSSSPPTRSRHGSTPTTSESRWCRIATSSRRVACRRSTRTPSRPRCIASRA